jgi:hypothetical protein
MAVTQQMITKVLYGNENCDHHSGTGIFWADTIQTSV